MTTTLRDALMDAAGPVTVVPPEHEIERRSRRLRRNSWLLEAGAVVAVALVFLAVLVLPDDDAPTVRTIGPAQQERDATTEGDGTTHGDGAAGSTTTITSNPRAALRGTTASVPTVTVTVPGSQSPPPPPGFVGPPPPGARVAFAHATRIETMRPDGTDRRVLYDDGRFHTLGGWSPKRDRLALVAWDGEAYVLAILDLFGGTLTTIVRSPESKVLAADWSPDGKWIAYSSREPGQSHEWEASRNLRLVRPDGSGDHELPVRACGPAWAPDSKRIAAVSCLGSGAPLDMMIVEADGSGVTTLPGMRMANVSWSPDGKWLAGPRLRESSIGEYEVQPLTVFRPDGSHVRTLPSGSSFYRAAWTTDSARLIYASNPPSTLGSPCGVPTARPCDHHKSGLYSIAIDGSDEVELTSQGEAQPVMPWR